LLDESLIGNRRFATQRMIEMGNDQFPAAGRR